MDNNKDNKYLNTSRERSAGNSFLKDFSSSVVDQNNNFSADGRQNKDSNYKNETAKAFPKVDRPSAFKSLKGTLESNQQSKPQGNVKIEKRPDTYGSLGKVETEGYFERRDAREVLSFEEEDDVDASYDNYDEIRKTMIFGEILNNPRFKNPYKK